MESDPDDLISKKEPDNDAKWEAFTATRNEASDDVDGEELLEENTREINVDYINEQKKNLGQVHEIEDIVQWDLLRYKTRTISSIIILSLHSIDKANNDIMARFIEAHKKAKHQDALCVVAPQSLISEMETNWLSEHDEVLFVKNVLIVHRIPIETQKSWQHIDDSFNRMICFEATLVIVGFSYDIYQEDIFEKDIHLAFAELSLTDEAVVHALMQAQKCVDIEGLNEYYPVKCQRETNEWAHLLFSINSPKQNVLKQLKYILSNPFVGRINIIYCGHGDEDGSWDLIDDKITYSDITDILKILDKATGGVQISGKMILNCCYGGKWIEPHLQSEYHQLRIIGEQKPISMSGYYKQDIVSDKLCTRLIPKGCITDLAPPPLEPRILPSQPTVVIFPAAHGDSSMFTINGYTLLVDGGYEGKPCFWNYINGLDHINDVVITHLDQDHIRGIGVLLRVLNERNDDIGIAKNGQKAIKNLYFNCPYNFEPPMEEAFKHFKKANRSVKEGYQVLDLWQKIHKSGSNFPKNCVAGTLLQQREVHIQAITPIVYDELQEFMKSWEDEKKLLDSGFGKKLTMTNMASISLLVSTPNLQHHYVLFTGDAPQNQLLAGLTNSVVDFDSKGLDVDVLYVPHHGSSNNTNMDFYKKVRATYYILSSNGKRYKHPDHETLTNIAAAINKWTPIQHECHPSVNIVPTYRTTYNAARMDIQWPPKVHIMDPVDLQKERYLEIKLKEPESEQQEVQNEDIVYVSAPLSFSSIDSSNRDERKDKDN